MYVLQFKKNRGLYPIRFKRYSKKNNPILPENAVYKHDESIKNPPKHDSPGFDTPGRLTPRGRIPRGD